MTGDFPCSVCSRVFDTPQGRGIHESRVHEKDTYCKTCANLIPMEADKLSYCSSSCRDLFHEDIERESDTCLAEGCNNELTGFNRKFCSRSCSAGANIDENRHNGLSGVDNPVFRDDVPNDKIRELYVEEEMSTHIISEQLDVDVGQMTVYNHLQQMGVKMRDDTFGHTQKTSFGLEVRSGFENVTAEWLDRFGPEEWEYEPKDFPGPFVPDFVLGGDKVIEVWGMDSDSYNEKRHRKEDWYSKEGYELISVESQDINDMKQMMRVSK